METGAGGGSLMSALGNRWVKLLAAVGCVVLLGWLLYALRTTLIPFVLAAVAAYIVNPAVEFLNRRLRVPRGLVVAVFLVALTGLLVGAATLGISYVIRTLERVVPQAERALYPSEEPMSLAERARAALQTIPNEIRVQIELAVQNLPATVRENFREISASVLFGFGAVFRMLLRLIVTSFHFVLFFVVTAYLLTDRPALGRKARELLPARHQEAIMRVVSEIDSNIHAYYRGLLLVCLILGVIYSAGLLICGVDFAVLLGVAGGLADMVPYLGLVVGMLPALAFALVPYVGILKPIGVIAVFAIGETLAGVYLAPKIIGRRVGLHPVIVLLAIMVFGRLFGFLGVVFAVPLAAVLRVLLRELVAYYKRRLNAAQPP